MVYRLFLLLIVPGILTQNSLSGYLTVLDSAINHFSDYQFLIFRSNDVSALPQNAQIYIEFPTQSYVNLTDQVTNCTYISQITQLLAFDCNIVSKKLNILNVFNEDTEPSYFTLTIKNIQNPQSTKVTDPFKFNILDASNNVLEHISTITFRPQPGSLLKCRVNSLNQIVGQLSRYTFTFQVENQMEFGGSLQITLPYLYNVDNSKENMLSQNEPTFCQLLLSQNISCQPLKDTFGTQLSIQINERIDKNITYSVIIGNIKNPYQTSPFGQFIISTFDKFNQVLDRCSSLTVQISIPNTIIISQFTTQTRRVNSMEFGNLSFQSTVPYFRYYKINITIPPELIYSPSSSNPIVSPSLLDITNTEINGNSIHFSQPFSSQSIIGSSESFYIYLFQLINSNSTKPTSPFKIIVYEQIGNKIYIVEQTLAELTFQAVPTQLITPVISALYPLINQTTQLVINLTFNQKYNNSAYVKIIVPTEMKVLDSVESPCTQISGPLANFSMLCQGIANDSILIKNIFSTIVNNTRTWVKFTTPLVNTPLSTRKTSTSFKFYTYYDTNQFQVEILTNNIFFISEPGKIFQQNVQIIINNSVVGAISDYVILFKISNAIPVGGYFNITNSSLSYFSDNLSKNFQIIVESNLNLITLKNTVENQINSGSLIQIGLKNLTNPISMKPTASFAIKTFDRDQTIIDSIADRLFVSVNQPSNFVSVNIQPYNNTNGIKTDYQLDIIFQVQHLTDSAINIIIPQEIANLESIACFINARIISNQISCTKFQQNQDIIINMKLLNEQKPYDKLTIIYGPQRNPFSIKPISSFQVMTLSDNYLIEQRLQNISFITIPSSIQNFQVIAIQLILYEQFSIQIKFSSVNTLPKSTYIVLTLPQEIQVVNYECSALQGILNTGLKCEIFKNNSQKVKISLLNQLEGSFQDQNLIGFQLCNLTIKQLIQRTSHFSIETFTSDNFYVDLLQNVGYLEVFCTLPCRSCNNLNNNCTICFEKNITEYYLLDSFSQPQKCSKSCQSGYLAIGNQCQKCNFSCSECSINPNNCTSCNFNYYLQNNSCTEQCPAQYYADKKTLKCEKCIYPCLECNVIATNCTKCKFNYLYLNECIEYCPSGFYQNNKSQSCTKCVESCKECKSDTQCQSCYQNSSLKYLYNQNCVEVCPGNTYIDDNQICQICDPNCKTCEGLYNNCTSCYQQSNFKYVYQGQCVQTCPNNTIQYKGTCLNCNFLCQSCKQEDYNFCYSCIEGYYLYNNICIKSCPDGYYKNDVLQECIKCEPPCLTCLTKLQCTSCISNDPNNFLRYLYNNSCVSQCPKDISILNGLNCQACQDSCQTCEDNIYKCTSCKEGYLFNSEKSSCTKECQSGYFEEKGQCVGCNPPCKSCQINSQTCTSCVENSNQPYLLNNICLANCPKNYYQVKELGKCQQCPAPCIDCNDPGYCIKCDPQSEYKYQYKGSCVKSCEETMYVNNQLQCIKCALGCSACDINQTYCFSCHNGFYLYQNECVSQCPESYYGNAELNQCISKINYSTLPFPFLIIAFVLNCGIFFGKWHRPDTWITGNLLAAISIPETAARLWFLASIYTEQIQGNLKMPSEKNQVDKRLLQEQLNIQYHDTLFETLLKLMIISMIIHYTINIIILGYHIIKLQKSELTQKWRQKQLKNRLSEGIILSITGVVSSKCLRFLYSNFIGFEFLNIQIQNFEKFFSIINKLSLINLVISAIPTIVACILGIYAFQNLSIFFLHLSIECLTLTLIVEILTILDAQRRKKCNNILLSKVHSEIQSQESIKSEQYSILNQSKKPLIKDKDDGQMAEYDSHNILDSIYKEQNQLNEQSESKQNNNDFIFQVDNVKTGDKLINQNLIQLKTKNTNHNLFEQEADLNVSENQEDQLELDIYLEQEHKFVKNNLTNSGCYDKDNDQNYKQQKSLKSQSQINNSCEEIKNIYQTQYYQNQNAQDKSIFINQQDQVSSQQNSQILQNQTEEIQSFQHSNQDQQTSKQQLIYQNLINNQNLDQSEDIQYINNEQYLINDNHITNLASDSNLLTIYNNINLQNIHSTPEDNWQIDGIKQHNPNSDYVTFSKTLPSQNGIMQQLLENINNNNNDQQMFMQSQNNQVSLKQTDSQLIFDNNQYLELNESQQKLLKNQSQRINSSEQYDSPKSMSSSKKYYEVENETQNNIIQNTITQIPENQQILNNQSMTQKQENIFEVNNLDLNSSGISIIQDPESFQQLDAYINNDEDNLMIPDSAYSNQQFIKLKYKNKLQTIEESLGTQQIQISLTQSITEFNQTNRLLVDQIRTYNTQTNNINSQLVTDQQNIPLESDVNINENTNLFNNEYEQLINEQQVLLQINKNKSLSDKLSSINKQSQPMNKDIQENEDYLTSDKIQQKIELDNMDMLNMYLDNSPSNNSPTIYQSYKPDEQQQEQQQQVYWLDNYQQINSDYTQQNKFKTSDQQDNFEDIFSTTNMRAVEDLINTNQIKPKSTQNIQKKVKGQKQLKIQTLNDNKVFKLDDDSNNSSQNMFTKFNSNFDAANKQQPNFNQNIWKNRFSGSGKQTRKPNLLLPKIPRTVTNSADNKKQNLQLYDTHNQQAEIQQEQEDILQITRQIIKSQESQAFKDSKLKFSDSRSEDKTQISFLKPVQSIKTYNTFRQSFASDLNPYKQKQPIDQVLESYSARNISIQQSNLNMSSKKSQLNNKKIDMLKNTYK